MKNKTSSAPRLNPHAVALGRLGASKGGKASRAALSPEALKQSVTTAIHARWARKDAAFVLADLGLGAELSFHAGALRVAMPKRHHERARPLLEAALAARGIRVEMVTPAAAAASSSP